MNVEVVQCRLLIDNGNPYFSRLIENESVIELECFQSVLVNNAKPRED